jgi:hypothetical protein
MLNRWQWMLFIACCCGGIAMTVQANEKSNASKKLLRHVVLFQFKEGTSPAEVTEVEDAFRALPKQIDAIADFEWGTDVSVENRARGFTHCFFVSFHDEKGRQIYLPHPAHEEFKKLVGPRIENVLVIDYWSRN